MTTPLRVLILEDSEDDFLLLLRAIERGGFEPAHRREQTPEGVRAALQEEQWDLILSDFKMPRFNARQALAVVQEMELDIPFIIVSGTVGEETAVEAMKSGAHDYLSKSNLKRLCAAIERELRDADMRREHRRAEASLRESERMFRTLFDTSPDAIVMTDLQGIIQRANRQAAAMCSLVDPGALSGTSAFELIDDSDRERAVQNIRKTFDRGFIRGMEYKLIRADGSRFTGEMNTSVIPDEQGQPYALMAVVRDVSERKQMQARLAQADRMASVGMLAAGVAHEINNPLAYVMYNLSSLADDLPGLMTALGRCWSQLAAEQGVERAREVMAEAARFCEEHLLDDVCARAAEAAEGASRIRDIVRDLRTFSRVEEDRTGPVQLNAVIETAINMAYNEIKYRARLVKDFGDVPLIVANDGRLSQVFLNLLVNAAQAIDEGAVEKNEIRVRTWCEGEQAYAEVRDSGRGIAPEHLDRLFDPFFTTKPVGVGSGLGLSICHNIIRGYRGDIQAASTPGAGSSFTVQLPVADEDAFSAPRPEETSQLYLPTRRGRILVVDDEPIIGATVRRVLMREHDVELAAGGAAARARLEQDAVYDLILCDLVMPDVSGMDLYDWLEENHPELCYRVVFISGGAFTPRAAAFVDRVPNVLIEKPFEPKSLRSVVRKLLDPSARGP